MISKLTTKLQSPRLLLKSVAQDKQTDQWNRTENPEMNPGVCGQVIFEKGTKTIQWGLNGLSTNGAGTR